MNKRFLLLVGLVLIFFIIVVSFFFSAPKGNLVFNAKDYYLPYTVKFPGQATIELPCSEVECATEVEAGDYNFYIEKEGYYVQEGSATVVKNETTYFDVSLEVVPGLVESAGVIDDSVFEKCYSDSVECGLDSEFHMAEDSDTGYMALWEGETRRATFTKGMEQSLVFINEDSAVVYDVDSGDAYFVNFGSDSRDFAFNVSNLIGVMFLDNGGYLVQTDGGISWVHEDGEIEQLYFGYDLNRVVYEGVLRSQNSLIDGTGTAELSGTGGDGKVYFIGDSSTMGDLVAADGIFVGSYDGINYYVILDGLEIDPENTVMGSDEYGIYVKDGEQEYQVEW